MNVEAGFGGQSDGGEQDLVLGLEPGQCLPVIRGLDGDGAGLGGARATGSMDGSAAAGVAAVCR